MGWTVRLTASAVRDLARLDPQVARRVIKKLEDAAAADPPRGFERLVGADDHKLRVGDHRVLALFSYETRTILVERVEHRSRVYRK